MEAKIDTATQDLDADNVDFRPDADDRGHA
jgi:hypothetical protein